MDSEFDLKVGIFGTFLFLGLLFSLFMFPIFTKDTEVSGEIIGSYQVPTEGGSKKYIKIRLDDGSEIKSRVDRIHQNSEGKKVTLLKRVAGTTEYVLQEIIE